MNKGILNQSLVEKNIQQLTFYSNEEQKKLNQICVNMLEASTNYKSSNTSLLVNHVTMIQNQLPKINEKRTYYRKVLNDAINQYNRLSLETKRAFSKDVKS